MLNSLLTNFRHSSTRIALLLVLIALMPFPVGAQCLTKNALHGVNIAGAEFNSGKLPGVLNKDYLYPDSRDLDYVVALGANVIRLPFRWERIQPELFEKFDSFELGNLVRVVKFANARGLCVILDVHNYGEYRKSPIGSDEVPVTAFYDLWRRLSRQFSNPEDTIFGLMNEPAKMPIALWATTAQSTIFEIRKEESKNIILASGGRWSGAHEWFKKFDGASNAEEFSGLTDPEQRTWIEVHQYADTYFSGTEQTCINPERFKKIFTPLASWAQSRKIKLFLGEFGVAPNDNCLAGLSEILVHVADTGVWSGWTYWAVGRWWGNYPMSIQPKDGVEPPQTKVIRKYISQ
jgi:endoglucanase